MENREIKIRLAWENKYEGGLTEQCYMVGEVYEMKVDNYPNERIVVRSIRAMEPLYPKELSFDDEKVTISTQTQSEAYGWLTVEETETYAKNMLFAVAAVKAIKEFINELENGKETE